MKETLKKGSFKFLLYSSTMLTGIASPICTLATTIEQANAPTKTAVKREYQDTLAKYEQARAAYVATKEKYEQALEAYKSVKAKADTTYATATQLKV
jgi:hypothetical protein